MTNVYNTIYFYESVILARKSNLGRLSMKYEFYISFVWLHEERVVQTFSKFRFIQKKMFNLFASNKSIIQLNVQLVK